MNKKLLAIAIAGVLAAPLAQAQTANVTLYGRINIDAEVIINAKTGSPTSTSIIGVAGTRPAGRTGGGNQAEPLPGELELVALRRAGHGIAGRRSECDFPDRIQRQRRFERRPVRHA